MDYFTDPLPKAKLKELIQKTGLPVEELIRKKDQLFGDLRLGEKNAEKVVERAQKALLKAKSSGKNQTCILND